MDERFYRHAEIVRAKIVEKNLSPLEFREALLEVPNLDRDTWVDAVLGLNECAEDGPELPRGCVPYLPCSVETLVRIAENTPVTSTDVFMDIGSGAGRAAALMHLLTGAASIGIEVQSAHLRTACKLVERLSLSNVTFVQADAAEMLPAYSVATVFFLYCPFSGTRLERFLKQIEGLVRERTISICTVDLPLPDISWLELRFSNEEDVCIYRSRNV